MLRMQRVWWVGLLALGLSACGGSAEQKAEQALIQVDGAGSSLKVNGVVVPESILEAYARKRGWDIRDPGQRDQVLDKVGEVVAMGLEAERQGLLADPVVQADLALERINLLSGMLIERDRDAQPITEEAMRAAYDQQVAAAGAEDMRVAHVLFDNEAAAQAAQAELASGTAFTQMMAGRVGQSGVKDARELGWIKRNMVPESLGAALAATAAGQNGAAPVQTEYGWHVYTVLERRPAQIPPFEQVKDGIRNTLQRERALALVNEIKQKAKIEK